MADDIVTQLRWVSDAKEWVKLRDWTIITSEAADEIEQLRELADLLATKVRHSATCDWMWSSNNPCSCGVSEARKRYKGVRGE